MKFRFLALSIVSALCLLPLGGCESLGIRDLLAKDQVPPAIKAEPILVSTPEPVTADASHLPRLGDVPFKPKDFSPKIVNDHYMNELEYHRDEAVVSKKEAQEEDPLLSPLPARDAPLSSQSKTNQNFLSPPQLPGY